MTTDKTLQSTLSAVRSSNNVCVRRWPFCAMSLAVVSMAAVGLGRHSLAQEDGRTDEPRNCLNLMTIDRTEVVDDDTMLFYTRNGAVYRNELKQACPTLGFEQRFMYRTTLTQLCDIDVITVLQDVGFGFLPTASCGLGKFQPIDEQAAEELLAGTGRGDAR